MQFEQLSTRYNGPVRIVEITDNLVYIFYTTDDESKLIDKWERDEHGNWECVATCRDC